MIIKMLVKMHFGMKAAAAVLMLALSQVAAQTFTGPQDPRLTTALTLDVPSTGVSTTPNGRVFLVLARIDGSKGAQIVEYHSSNKSFVPYPNVELNSYAAGKNPATHFVSINAQRIGPDGKLYLVDTGKPTFQQPVILPSGPKLIQIDIQTNCISRIYPMGNATRSNSLLDDVRFHLSSGKAYLTDAGSPGLIILDLATGRTQRILDNDPSTGAYLPISAEGHILYAASTGISQHIYADQLEVSPDGKYLYYQPASGGLSRIETEYLVQAFYNTSLASGPISEYVDVFAQTPSTGGTAIDARGNIYVSDTDSQRIISISPNGTKTLLVQDPRLTWVDAMWVGSDKKLYLPAAQLNRGTPFGNGKSNITKPLYVYTLDIGVGPSAIDHA